MILKMMSRYLSADSAYGLDSIDALELGMALKKKYHIDLSEDKEENKKHFYSVKTIADYIRSCKSSEQK